MKIKTRMPVTQNRTTVGIFTGIITAIITSLILIAVATGLVTGNKLSEEASVWVVFFVRAIAVLAGVLIGTGLAKEKHLVTAGIVTVGYLMLLLCLSIVMYDETFKSFGNGLLSTLTGGVIGCLIRLKSQNKPRRTKKMKV